MNTCSAVLFHRLDRVRGTRRTGVVVVCGGSTGPSGVIAVVWPRSINRSRVVRLLRNGFRNASRRWGVIVQAEFASSLALTPEIRRVIRSVCFEPIGCLVLREKIEITRSSDVGVDGLIFLLLRI